MKKTISAIIIIFLLIGGLVYWEYHQEQGFLRIGIEQPSVIALFETSLASKITSTATSMTLVSGTDKDGNSISGKFGFIIDEGGSDEEFVIADCSGTTCTNMLRGISVTTGNTEITALKKEHRRGASVKITDYPLLTILQQLTSGSASFEDLLYYAETIGTTGFGSAASTSNLATKYYVDYVGAGGFTSLNVGTSYGLKALGTSPETVGIDLLTNGGLAFSGGDLYVYTSASQGLSFDDAGRLFFNASDSFAFTGTNSFSGTTNFTGAMQENSVVGGLVPAGSVTAYASISVPVGWLPCNGAAVSRTTYATLFSVIGTTYGIGDNSTTFNVPSMGGRNVVGYGSASYDFAEVGGEASHSQSVAELAAHTHGTTTWFTGAGNGQQGIQSNASNNTYSALNTDSTGSGTAFNVLDPYIVLYYIIKY